MEAVPRLSMISFPGRITSDNDELSKQIKKYIRHHYHEDPDSYNSEIFELEGLRRSAINASPDFVGCSTLKKYYCQLSYLASRFPFHESGLKITFNWFSAFDNNSSNSGDISLEMDSILYNIAALHTSLGAIDSRTTADGMKISCTHFQCAAGAFESLAQHSKGESELNPLLMNFMMNLSLSQAQECILEKSMTDHRKPNIIAKVAMQVIDYLKQTMKNLESFKKSNSLAVDLVGSKLTKLWQRHCEFKVAYYYAVTYFHQGLHSEEQQKMGERLAYLQGAVEKLDEAGKGVKNLEGSKAIIETITFANDVIKGKQTACQKENEFVYHEKVPTLASLSEVKGASLVKGISFSINDIDVAGPDIFSRLVPIEAHHASSMYSEEKAKLLRGIGQCIQEKNEELESYLASMQLDSLSVDDNLDLLPQVLVECCADLNSRDALKELINIMATINQYYHNIKQKISDLQAIIQVEEEKEKEFSIIIGSKKGSVNQLLIDHKRELMKYQEAHETAMENNQALHSAITQHRTNIGILSQPLNHLLEELPSVAGVESEGDRLTRNEVQRLLNKVNEMQEQRQTLDGQLHNDIHNDDITKQLITNNGDISEFFNQQLKKHDPLVTLLEQNMKAQVNILQALSEANATYGAARRQINQMKADRMKMIDSFICSYNTFLSITSKASDAKEFYTKLGSQVNKVESKLKSLCKTQEEDRESKLGANIKKFVPKEVPQSQFQPSVSSSAGPKLKDFLFTGGKSTLPSKVSLDSVVNTESITYPPSAPSPNIGYSTSATFYSTSATLPASFTSPYYAPAAYQQNPKINTSTSVSTNSNNNTYSSTTQADASSYGINYQQQTSYAVSSNYDQSHYSNVNQPSGYDTYPSINQISSRIPITNNSSSNSSFIHQGGSNAPYATFETTYGPAHTQPAAVVTESNSYDASTYSGNILPNNHPVSEYRASGTINTSLPISYNQDFKQTPVATVVSQSCVIDSSSGQMSSLATNLAPTYNASYNHEKSAGMTVVNPSSSIYGSSYTYGQSSTITSGNTTLPYNEGSGTTIFDQRSAGSIYAGQSQASNTANQSYMSQPQYPSQSYARPNESSQVSPYNFNSGTQQYGGGTIYSDQTDNSSNKSIANRPIYTNYDQNSVNYSKSENSKKVNYVHGDNQNIANVDYGKDATISQYPMNQQPKLQSNESTAPLKKKSNYVSNVDLLSDLDLNPNTMQWSPLQPNQTNFSPSNVPSSTVISTSKTAEIKNNSIASIPDSCDKRINSILDITKIAKHHTPHRSTSLVDPLSNDETLVLFASETEKFSKFVQGLDKKPLNGPTNLELKWKELVDILETKCASLKVSVGRCYPLSNRFPDILPFDANRVQLPSARDDYINASHVQLKGVHESIPLILTQAPLSNTMQDFWTMIWESHAEIIVSLNTDAEVKGQNYISKEGSLDIGSYTITVKQTIPSACNCWIQQTVLLQHNTLKASRVVLHNQFVTWPPGAMPESPGPFLKFIYHIHCLQKQQRNKLKPMIVHCISGTGRSGIFSVLSSCVKHLQLFGSLADIWNLVIELSQQRKFCIQDKSHLLFLYSAALYNAQEALMKRGILSGKTTFDEGPREKTHVRHPSADLLTSDLSRMKSKLGLDSDSQKSDTDSNLSRTGSQSSLVSSGSLIGVSSNVEAIIPNSPVKCSQLPPNLAASLDPAQLDLSAAKTARITKDSFMTPSQGLGNIIKQTGDPFSDIDPLWKQK